MHSTDTNHYATLGLDRDCTEAQIRSAYRILAKQHHPDLNPNSGAALRHTQALNAAYETLSDPERRLAYDAELDLAQKPTSQRRGTKSEKMHLPGPQLAHRRIPARHNAAGACLGSLQPWRQ